MATVGESGQMIMPVAPTGNGGFGGLGNDGAWWIILFVIIFGAGRFGGGYGAGNGGGYDPAYAVQAGFNQAALTTGIANVQSAVTNGIAGVNQALCTGFSQAEISANNRQMANMQQNFALQQQFSDCCCENRLAVANLGSQIAQENCADRQAVADALYNITTQINDLRVNMNDQFCQDRLDRKDERIAELERQLNERDRLAANNAMESRILAHNEAQTTALEQYLAPVARPAYIVQNPNCGCNQYGYGYNCPGVIAA